MPFKFTPGCCACGSSVDGPNCGGCTLPEAFAAEGFVQSTVSGVNPGSPVTLDTGPQPFSLTLPKVQRADGELVWAFGTSAGFRMGTLAIYFAALPEFLEFADPVFGLGSYGPYRGRGSILLGAPGWLLGTWPTRVAPALDRRCLWAHAFLKFSELSYPGVPPNPLPPPSTPPATGAAAWFQPAAFSGDPFTGVPGMCRDSTPFAISYGYSGVTFGGGERIGTGVQATLTAIR